VSTTRVLLSTHYLRRTARAAKRHYERMQKAALVEGGCWPPTDEPARQSVYELGINPETPIHVLPAKHERGKWVVVGIT
jgi:hypothetical protein